MNGTGNAVAIIAVVAAVMWLCSDDRPKTPRDTRPLVIVNHTYEHRRGGGITRGLVAGALLLLVLGLLASLALFVAAVVVGAAALVLAALARAVRGPMPRARGRASAHHDPHDIPDTGFDLRPPHIKGELLDGPYTGDPHTGRSGGHARDPAVNHSPNRDPDQ